VKNKKIIPIAAVIAVLAFLEARHLQGAANILTELVGDISLRLTNANIDLDGLVTIKDRQGVLLGAFNTAQGGFGARRPTYVTTADTQVLGLTDCGAVIVANKASATQVFTLPPIANSTGCMVTFVAGSAAGEILVNAAAVATCVITTFGAVGATPTTAIVTDSSCETGLKNTAATNAVGDSLTLVSDGTRWLGVGITTGIWNVQ
jgi:hypothetical protein